LAGSRTTAEKLGHIILELRDRDETADSPNTTRSLKDSISIDVWVDDSGKECVEIISARDVDPLEVKGILHDALYALANKARAAI
jgi:hypothetical protein